MTEPLSYHYLTLVRYMAEHHPDRIGNTDFIHRRSQEADRAFERASKEGHTFEESREKAFDVLFRGLRFSPLDLLLQILEEEFPKERETEDERLAFAIQMLERYRTVIESYPYESDGFAGSTEYVQLYTELTGCITLYLKSNGLSK
jgi:hypothetical protein